jgi:hypothetical protein
MAMPESRTCLEELDKTLPEFVKPSDLISLGIAGSRTTLAADRKAGKGIPFVQFSKQRVRYPKKCVLEHVKKHFYETE